MSREHAPMANQSKPESKLEKLKDSVLKSTPRSRHDTDDSFVARLKKNFTSAAGAMQRKDLKHGRWFQNHNPHQGAKECARRVKQLNSGAICNYMHGKQYPSYY